MKAKPKLALVRPGARKAAAVAVSRPASVERIERGEARLVVQLPTDVHRAVKAKAAKCGLSVREYVLSLLREDGLIDDENRPSSGE